MAKATLPKRRGNDPSNGYNHITRIETKEDITTYGIHENFKTNMT